jgi:hypothetical protein
MVAKVCVSLFLLLAPVTVILWMGSEQAAKIPESYRDNVKVRKIQSWLARLVFLDVYLLIAALIAAMWDN